MLSFVAAAALAASVQAQPAAQPRKAFAACLTKFVGKALEDRMSASDFEAAFKATCEAEETAFRKAVVAYDVKTGISRADADEGATLQIEDYRLNASESFTLTMEGAGESE